jgi:hypothetical protein
MMNLELFFVAEALTGNRLYRQHAISHADKTMVNHVRDDGMDLCFSLFNYSVFRNRFYADCCGAQALLSMW